MAATDLAQAVSIANAAATTSRQAPLTHVSVSHAFDEPLAREWGDLAERTHAMPYLQSGWIEAWWRAFGQGGLEISVARRDGRMVAILPMARTRYVLRALANCHTPRFAILAEDNQAAAALADAIFMQNAAHVSLTSLNDSALAVCRESAEAGGYTVVVRPYERQAYVELKETWSEYHSGLSRTLRENLRRRCRKLSGKGTVTLEVCDGREGLEESLQGMFDVEASGWKGKQGTAIRSNPRTLAFYTDIAHWAAGRGTLRLFTLQLGRRPLAAYFALADRGVCYLLKSGYDEAFAQFSPSTLLMGSLIQYGFSAGWARIELLGDASPWKLCWAHAVKEYRRLEAFAPGIAGSLAQAAFVYVRPVTSRARMAYRAATTLLHSY